MKKIRWMALFVALCVPLLFMQPARAAGSDPHPPRPGNLHLMGQVTSVEADGFFLETQRGELDVRVDEKTHWRDSQANEAHLDDLSAGGWVAVGLVRTDDSQLLAVEILVFPPGFDPTLADRRIRGLVEEVDLQAGTLTLQPRRGPAVSLLVVPATVFIGPAQTLADVQAGMIAAAGVDEMEDGSLQALSLSVRLRLENRVGKVTGVDLENSRFTMDTRGGEPITLIVDENTRFRSPNNQIAALPDLEQEMWVAVRAQVLEDGRYQARQVGVTEHLPHFDLRVGGRVTAVAHESFTLETRDGRTLEFSVSEETRFRSPGGRVQSLAGLEPGMLLVVGAREDEAGSLFAVGVLFGGRK